MLRVWKEHLQRTENSILQELKLWETLENSSEYGITSRYTEQLFKLSFSTQPTIATPSPPLPSADLNGKMSLRKSW
jgi:hypothetical protein